MPCEVEPASLETSLILACRPLKHEEGGLRLALSQKGTRSSASSGLQGQGPLHSGTGFLSVTGITFRQGHFRSRVQSAMCDRASFTRNFLDPRLGHSSMRRGGVAASAELKGTRSSASSGLQGKGPLHSGTGFLSVTGITFRLGHFRNRVPSNLLGSLRQDRA